MSGLEPMAIIVLTKAIDFLFGEAGKLMEERRSARQKRGDEIKAEHNNISSQVIVNKETLKGSQPKLLELREIPKEVEHSINQIRQYGINKRLLEEQAAKYGGFTFAPLIVQNQIRDAEEEIYNNCQKLKHLIEEVYDQKITISGFDD
jgi:hypothetical protein